MYFMVHIVYCILHYLHYIIYTHYIYTTYRLNNKYIKSKKRILELSGEMLGELNMIELRSLLTTQKLGLERTHDALHAFGEDA